MIQYHTDGPPQQVGLKVHGLFQLGSRDSLFPLVSGKSEYPNMKRQPALLLVECIWGRSGRLGLESGIDKAGG